MNSEPEVQLPKLSVRPAAYFDKSPFDYRDKLDRKPLAIALSGLIDRLRDGTVLVIDGGWGSGKTWFGKNWAEHLKQNGHKVGFIDAFEQDYVDDPFLLIAEELSKLFDSDDSAVEKFKKKTTKVLTAILPTATKVLLNLAGTLALGRAGLASDVVEATKDALKTTVESTTDWATEQLAEFRAEQESVREFKNQVLSFSSHQSKPTVIFVDELDRSREQSESALRSGSTFWTQLGSSNCN